MADQKKFPCCDVFNETIASYFNNATEGLIEAIDALTEKIQEQTELECRIAAVKLVYDNVNCLVLETFGKFRTKSCDLSCCESASKAILSLASDILAAAFKLVKNEKIKCTPPDTKDVDAGSCCEISAKSHLDILLENLISQLKKALKGVLDASCKFKCDCPNTENSQDPEKPQDPEVPATTVPVVVEEQQSKQELPTKKRQDLKTSETKKAEKECKHSEWFKSFMNKAEISSFSEDSTETSLESLETSSSSKKGSPRKGSPKKGSPRKGSPRKGSPRKGSPRKGSKNKKHQQKHNYDFFFDEGHKKKH